MWKLLKSIWVAITACLFFFTIFWLPKDLQDASHAAEPWRKILTMVDQLTAFKVFSGLLVLWVIWIDLRPFILRRLNLEQEEFSLADLAKLAQSRYGWKFGDDSFESLDFIDALRQSGVDTSLPVLGRTGCHQTPEDSKNAYPLIDIPPQHLVDYWIDVPRFFEGTNNYDIATYHPNYAKQGAFRDLHIKTKQAAKKWLREIAPKWRGRRESADKKAQKERARRNEWIKKDEDRVPQSLPGIEEKKQP